VQCEWLDERRKDESLTEAMVLNLGNETASVPFTSTRRRISLEFSLYARQF
jgi:hypothetical protein